MTLCACLAMVTVSAGCEDPMSSQEGFATVRIVSLNPGVDLHLRAIVDAPGGFLEYDVDEHGVFRVRRNDDALVALVTTRVGHEPEVHDILVTVPVGTPGGSYIAIPTSWRIASGRFAGTTIPISLADAFQPPCPPDLGSNCEGFYPAAWADRTHMWEIAPEVALDMPEQSGGTTAAMAAQLETIVSMVNETTGRNLLRTGVASPTRTEPGRFALGQALVRIDSSIAPFLGWTTWRGAANGRIMASVTTLQRAALVEDEGTVVHEIMHSLGFKHTCAWPSIMGGYGCQAAPELTEWDVAYLELAAAYDLAQRATGAAGFGPALDAADLHRPAPPSAR